MRTRLIILALAAVLVLLLIVPVAASAADPYSVYGAQLRATYGGSLGYNNPIAPNAYGSRLRPGTVVYSNSYGTRLGYYNLQTRRRPRLPAPQPGRQPERGALRPRQRQRERHQLVVSAASRGDAPRASSDTGSPAPAGLLLWSADDIRFMTLALHEAQRAGERGEVPVGAVLVQAGAVLGSRGNEREARRDPTAHAEMLALRDAAGVLGGWRILDATLYVTLEPCPMCAGALVQARVARLVYAARDPKAGAAGSVLDVTAHPALNHRVDVRGGLLEAEAQAVMQAFFAARR